MRVVLTFDDAVKSQLTVQEIKFDHLLSLLSPLLIVQAVRAKGRLYKASQTRHAKPGNKIFHL